MNTVICPMCNCPAKHDKGNFRLKILPHYYCSDDMIWSDPADENEKPIMWTDDGEEWLLRRDF